MLVKQVCKRAFFLSTSAVSTVLQRQRGACGIPVLGAVPGGTSSLADPGLGQRTGLDALRPPDEM